MSDGRRPENAIFDFHPRHVLDESDYVQYVVLKSRCPILAQKCMPIWPGVDGSSCTRKAWAKFIMYNFLPRDIEEPPHFTWEDCLKCEHHCKSDGASSLEHNYERLHRSSVSSTSWGTLRPCCCRSQGRYVFWVPIWGSAGCTRKGAPSNLWC